MGGVICFKGKLAKNQDFQGKTQKNFLGYFQSFEVLRENASYFSLNIQNLWLNFCFKVDKN
jgi:hypothetical protein